MTWLTSAEALSPASFRSREARYGYWMAHAAGQPNDSLLAKILASREAGIGALPVRLGLDPDAFAALLQAHFPTAAMLFSDTGAADEDWMDRGNEREDIETLLLAHRGGRADSEVWLAGIVAAACMGGDHLWQDLGLWSRADLGRLMAENFPALAERNDRDMKWKRFLYKQLCQAEGIYVCRAPSCEVCVDYARCFGPED